MTVSAAGDMKVLITGGAGFLGGQLAQALLHRGHLCGRTLKELVLADLAPPPSRLSNIPGVRWYTGALIEQAAAFKEEQFDLVFHLAAAVSAECEADLDLGLSANIDTTRVLLDALRREGQTRFIFASSVAVFGGDADLPMPSVIRDDTLPVPQSSYGIQKFICEQLVADYTRRGLIEGRSARLVTVTVRPGRPNRAASGFLSSIVREPLNGQEAVCPVPAQTAVAVSSPRRTIEGLITAAEATVENWGSRTALNMPALTIRVGEILDALEAVAGRVVRDRVVFQEDETVARLVNGWPAALETTRARRLGLHADLDFASIIQQFLDEQRSSHSSPKA